MSIYKKIFYIQSEIEKLIKDETNKFQKYQYFTEYQILNKLKPLLKKYKLALLMSDEDQTLEYFKEEREYLIKYLKRVRIVDTESTNDSEAIDFNFWAVGGNSDLAKAKGSAETYAMKYFLSKFFLIPVADQLDPDSR
jgi:hypothetical protein